MSDEKLLTKEIAEQFLVDEGSVDLNEFTAMDETAAESLARHTGRLSLKGVRELSNAVAASLAKHQGNLTLGSAAFTELSDAAAASLAKHEQTLKVSYPDIGELPKNPGPGHINLIKKLGASAASEYQPLEILCTEISDPMAQTLAEVEAPLSLISLKILESVPLARKLGSGESVELRALTELSPEIALELAFCQGALHLGGDGAYESANLQDLSPAAAENLARHSGELVLGISSISPASAETLALHTGSLTLVGLGELSAESAAALALYRGDLKLVIFGPENIAMRLLNKETGSLEIWWDPVTPGEDYGTLNQQIATAICQFKADSLSLSYSSLDPAGAEVIATTQFVLSLPVLKKIDIEVAQALQSHAGTLRLGGLEGFEISDEAASQLVQHVGPLELPEYGLAESAQAILGEHPSLATDDSVASDPYGEDEY